MLMLSDILRFLGAFRKKKLLLDDKGCFASLGRTAEILKDFKKDKDLGTKMTVKSHEELGINTFSFKPRA